MRVVFFFFSFFSRIHRIQSTFESVWEWCSFSRYAEYNKNYNRYDSVPRFPLDTLKTVKFESAWQWNMFPIGYTEFNENLNRYESGPRIPPKTLNTVSIGIGMTVVFVSYRITLNKVRIKIGMTAVLVSHRLHWLKWQLLWVWEWSSSFLGYTERNQNLNQYDSGLHFLSDNAEYSED